MTMKDDMTPEDVVAVMNWARFHPEKVLKTWIGQWSLAGTGNRELMFNFVVIARMLRDGELT